MDSPLESSEKNAALQIPDFRLVLDSHLQSCKIINEYCFKPLNLRSSVNSNNRTPIQSLRRNLWNFTEHRATALVLSREGLQLPPRRSKDMGGSKTQVISSGWLTSALGTFPKVQQSLLWESDPVWN